MKCQIWQDLVILGPRRLCEPSSCATGFVGADGQAELLLHGAAAQPVRSPRRARPFRAIYAAAVAASPELQQLGFTTQYGSLGSRLDAILGGNPTGEGRVDRLVDFTVGINPATGKGMERPPSIFYVDGYWRTDDSRIGVRVQRPGDDRRQQVGDPLVTACCIWGASPMSMSTSRTAGCLPAAIAGSAARLTCSGSSRRRTSGSAMPNGQVHEVDAVMLAGRDINFVTYAGSAATCCDGESYPMTFNGAVLGLRGVALARDWADPTRPETVCSTAQPPCRPITFVRGDTSCGVGAEGCWKFLSKDPVTGLSTSIPGRARFRRACRARASRWPRPTAGE